MSKFSASQQNQAGKNALGFEEVGDGTKPQRNWRVTQPCPVDSNFNLVHVIMNKPSEHYSQRCSGEDMIGCRHFLSSITYYLSVVKITLLVANS